MSIWDLFRRRAKPDDESPAPGWDAITAAFDRLYPGQTSPVHVMPAIRRELDPSDNPAAFDGISAYDGGDHWHFVTYGLTELYRKTDDDPAVSGAGFELTFKTPRLTDRPPSWTFAFLEQMGQQFWRGQSSWTPGATIATGPFDRRPTTTKTVCLLATDPAIPFTESPHGRVVFLQIVGIGEVERRRLVDAAQVGGVEGRAAELARLIAMLEARSPMLVTDVATL